MRIVSVLATMVLGIGLGAAAVLAPLSLRSSGGGSKEVAGDFASDWGAEAKRLMQMLSPRSDRTATAAEADQVPTVVVAAPGAGDRTMQHLSQVGGPPGLAAGPTAVTAPYKSQPNAAVADAGQTRTEPRKLASSRAVTEEQRASLVRELQIALKRVGCFEGEADGSWGTTTKKAMAAFTERVNASLPYEEPDYILLTLVQGHNGRACGKSCPAGQAMADQGRCLPTSVLAQADRAKNGDRAAPGEKAQVKPGPAGPAPAAVAIAAPSVGSAWSTTVVRAPVETGSIPAQAGAARAPATSSTVVTSSTVEVARPRYAAATAAPESSSDAARQSPAASQSDRLSSPLAAPLPGRMAIGGPAPRAADAAAPLAAAGGASEPAKSEAVAPQAPSAKLIAAPVPAAKPVERRVAAVQPEAASTEKSEPAPVTQVKPARSNQEGAGDQARQKRALPPEVVVRRPPPPPQPRVTYVKPPAEPSSSSKSRRLVYDLFQRPDRN